MGDNNNNNNSNNNKPADVAKRLLAKADQILANVDEAYIITSRNHKPRLMPKFRPEEVSLGKTLGQGGFGIVNEIIKFTLDPIEKDISSPNLNGLNNDSKDALPPPEESNNNNVNVNSNNELPNINNTISNDDDDDDDTEIDDGPIDPNRVSHVISNITELTEGNHYHYDIRKAKLWMEKRCQRKGIARYAIKRLHTHLSDVELARGMIDLAVEAKFLSVVWHPNIIKLRGIAKGPMVDKDFFIILDRLHGTLDQRINMWYHEEKRHKGNIISNVIGSKKRKKILHQMMVDRMTVAYDLAAAFFYLHENKLVYRDIKPENIGFDIRGDVKVFDFGLCKSLSPKIKARGDGYGYRLTGRAGSLPYMAPEVVMMETYDSKCDVFSFAILLWEMLALQQCCKGYTPTQFVERVVIGKERFPIKKQWPPLTRLMLPEAWDPDPRKRPDMKRIAILIRGDLNDMTNDETVLRRTKHMKNRSNHSFCELDTNDD